jgi:aldehyde dehydrogenase (NAD+)
MLYFLDFFGKQKVNLKTSIRKSYHWRIKQLDHLERMLMENKYALCDAIRKDYKVPPSEQVCEIGAPIAIIEFTRSQLREWVAPSDFKADSYCERYELSLNETSDSSLILLLNPIIAAISAGNPVVLKADDETPATNAILDDLLPQYFEPSDFVMYKC